MLVFDLKRGDHAKHVQSFYSVWEEYGRSGDVLVFDLKRGEPELSKKQDSEKVFGCEVNKLIFSYCFIEEVLSMSESILPY